MATKEKKIFAALRTEVDAIVLMNGTEPNLDHSFFYATGITSGLFENGISIVRPRKVEVLCTKLEELSAKEAGLKPITFSTQKELTELAKKKLGGMKRIGVNSTSLTHENFKFIRKCSAGARLVDVSKAIEEARMVKDADEIPRIKRACEIASEVADCIPDLVQEGDKETEAAAEVNYKMMKLGAEGPSFSTNASWGPATAEPHYVPGSRKLKKGQLALFDFGALYRRYCSDVTRTYICGSPNTKQKRMYEVVLEAQMAAIDAVREGEKGKMVDRAARDIIDASEFKGRFIHGTGHGLGLSVHDPGGMSPQRRMTLKEGMVLTVEPGVYIPGFGGVRIEDDVLVTKKGCRVLTPASKELARI
jgi:Xaa-Pro dipeptidase